MIDTLDQELAPGTRYLLSLDLQVDGASADAAPVLLTCLFQDATGRPLSDPPEGFRVSGTYGPHLQVGAPGHEGRLALTQAIVPPPGAASVRLTVHRWRARQVTALGPMRLEPEVTEPRAAHQVAAMPDPAPGGHEVLDSFEREVVPGDRWELIATFDQAFGTKDFVAAVRFLDASGQELRPTDGTPQSDQIGPFRYLAAGDQVAGFQGTDNQGLAVFVAPPGAERMALRLMRWGGQAIARVTESALRQQSETLLADGSIAVSGSGWQTLRLSVQLPAAPQPRAGLMALACLDDTGRPVPGPVEGAEPSLRFGSFVPLDADPLAQHDGILHHAVAIRPAAGTQQVAWRLHRLDDAAEGPRIVDPPSLQPVPDTLASLVAGLPQDACATAGEAPQVLEEVLGALPDMPALRPLRDGAMTLLGVAACTCDGAEWMRLRCHLKRPAGGLDRAELAMVPLYLDDTLNSLPGSALIGCGATRRLPRHQAVVLHPKGPDTAHSISALPVLETARKGLFLLVAQHPAPGIALERLEIEPVAPDRLFEGLDTSVMNRPQLVQWLEIAEEVGDLRARYLLCAALAVVDPATKGYAYRARLLHEALAPLDPAWHPRLQRAESPAPPDESRVFHVAPDAPEEALALARVQAGRGLSVVVTCPLGGASEEPVARDGLVEARDDGVTVIRPALQAFQQGGMAEATRLALETQLHARSLAQHRGGLIHAWPVPGDCGPALKGLALARAHDLPFVCSVGALVDRGRMAADAAALHDARTLQCLGKADRIVAGSGPLRHALVEEHGLPHERIVVLPDPLPPEFMQQAGLAPAIALRQRHLGKGPVLAVDATETAAHGLVLRVLDMLAPAHPGLRLLILGPIAAAQALHSTAAERGLAGSVAIAEPSEAAPLPLWLRCTSLFIAPGHRTQPWTLTLAMSQGVPALLPDSPGMGDLADDARTLAGAAGQGAEAWAERIAEVLAAPDDLRNRGLRARHWVTTERSPARHAARIRELYSGLAPRTDRRLEAH